jgi:phospholipid transport system substrate-binding protein
MSVRAVARFFIILLVAAAVALPVPTRAAPSDAAGFISDLGERAINVLTSTQSQADREAAFRKLFDEGFDVPGIARFVLGPYWRTATDAQRDEFIKLFEAFIIHAYVVRFSAYSGQQLKVTGSRPEGENSLVNSQITGTNNSPPVKVDWRVAKQDSGFKITDVVVEGVSMAVTERQEFASVIQRGGGQIDALLKALRERSGQG